jgi:hypothetical protein
MTFGDIRSQKRNDHGAINVKISDKSAKASAEGVSKSVILAPRSHAIDGVFR